MPLEAARAQAAEDILIPSSKVLGNIKRVRLTQAGALTQPPVHQDFVGIAILYDSGVTFFSFADKGRSGTFETMFGNSQAVKDHLADVVSVGGRKYMVYKGGTQVTAWDERIETPPSVHFTIRGIEYGFFDYSGNLKASGLLKAAREMR